MRVFWVLLITLIFLPQSGMAMGRAKKKEGCEIESSLTASEILPQVCSGSLRTQFDRDFKLRKDWFGGLGWESPCDPETPFGRLLIGIGLLKGIQTSNPHGLGSRGYAYAAGNVRVLKVRCDGNFYARTKLAVGENAVQLSKFFFNTDPLDRASTLVHEARHADGVFHKANDCPRGDSCDQSWSQNGANRFEVEYLRDIAAHGKNINPATRWLAAYYAQRIVDRGFNVTPEINVVAESGTSILRRWEYAATDYSDVAEALGRRKSAGGGSEGEGGSDPGKQREQKKGSHSTVAPLLRARP